MRRWPLLLLLVSGLLLLASLYLPWQEASAPDSLGEGRDAPILQFLEHGITIEGWGPEIGAAAGLFALGLVALAGAAFVRVSVADRLPLARFALLTGYGALAVAVVTRFEARAYYGSGGARLHFHFAYGAYLGLGAGLTAVLSALVLRRRPADYAMAAVASGLLIAFLLPWVRLTSHLSAPAYASATTAVAIAAAVWAPATRLRLLAAAAALVFTGATLRSLGHIGDLRYGAWLGLAFSVALFGLSLREARAPVRWPRHLVRRVPEAAAALFVVALFLPWQEVCAPGERCYATSGWAVLGSDAAALTVVAWLALGSIDAIAAFGLFAATQGFQAANFADYPSTHIRSGATAALVAAGVFVLTAMWRERPWRLRVDRLAPALPVVACAAYVAVLLVPSWHVLPGGPFGGAASALRFAPFSWLTIAGVLLAVRLARAWVERMADRPADVLPVVLLPLALLALAALELIRVRDGGLSWGGGIIAGLCLLLVVVGRLEQRGGLRVPEMLRVDRL